ncbi:MAG: transglutaminaseTgpA domain-containing protein [Oscillospiraceae bacterium]
MQEAVKKAGLPALFAAALSAEIMNLFFMNGFLRTLALCLALCAATFLFCTLVKRGRAFAPLIYLPMLAAVLLPVLHFVQNNGSRSFLLYFTGAAGDADTSGFSYAIFFPFCFLMASFVYYFTLVRYRNVALILVTLIPCAAYFKRTETIPLRFIILTVALYLLVIVHCRQTVLAKGIRVARNLSYYLTAAGFAAVVVGSALAIPKPSEAPLKELYYDLFNQNTNRNKAAIYDLGAFSEFLGQSPYGDLSRTVVATVRSDEPLYLRKQVFDLYDGTHWSRYETDQFHYGFANWADTAAEQNLPAFAAALKEAAKLHPSFVQQYHLSDALFDAVNTPVKTCEITYMAVYKTWYLLNVLNPISADADGMKLYRNESGEMFVNEKKLPASRIFNVQYYNEAYSKAVYDFAAQFTDQDAYAAFLHTANIFLPEGAAKDAVSAHITDLENAQAYYKNTYQPTSAKITALAQQITAGCTSDLEKAQAIERYFHNGDFVYDLYYVPPESDNAAEYFLFDSRRGTCSDFASAMALLAREAGLPARVTEGFLSSERDGTNSYVVREEDAHAFPEVFISGIGWMTFEPTVADSGGGGADGTGFAFVLPPFARIQAIIAAALLCIAGVLARGPIGECAFRVSIAVFPKQTQIRRLFLRARKAAARRAHRVPYTMTAGEVRSAAQAQAKCDLTALTDAFERLTYTNQTAAGDEKACYAAYRAFKTGLRKNKSKRRYSRRKK